MKIGISLLLILMIGIGAKAQQATPTPSIQAAIDAGDEEAFNRAVDRQRFGRSRVTDLGDTPWVGQLVIDFAGLFVGRCTGTLVAPHLVVTAAHCLLEFLGDPKYLPVVFHLGMTANGARETRTGRAIAIGAYTGENAEEDWAVIEINPIQSVTTFPKIYEGPLSALEGKELILVGYAHDPEIGRNGDTPYVDRHCQFRGRYGLLSDESFATDCYGALGSSGGPVLVRGRSGQWELAGIHSGARWFTWSTHGKVHAAASRIPIER